MADPSAHRALVCKDCGYELRGLPDGACPECGRRFSVAQLEHEFKQYLQSLPRLRLQWWLTCLLTPFGLVSAFFLLAIPFEEMVGNDAGFLIAAAIPGLVGLFIVIYLARTYDRYFNLDLGAPGRWRIPLIACGIMFCYVIVCTILFFAVLLLFMSIFWVE